MSPNPQARRAIVADPVYGILDFGTNPLIKDLVKSVIDREEFQRLRRISQLGLASYVFPGATHTRFAHSLGAAHLARLVVRHLREWHPDVAALEEREHLLVCAALLHDVGHGPFSHSFERVLDKGMRVSHEAWTAEIVRQRFSNIEHGGSVEDLASLFDAKAKLSTEMRCLKQIVSSQLDVDRMDYLVRDAHFAGVSLGRLDIGYLVSSLYLVSHDNQVLSLGVTPKGVMPYEAFALARHFMNRSVYFHPKVRVLEFMMEACLRSIVEDLRGKTSHPSWIPKYIRALSQVTTPDDSKKLVTNHLQSYLDLTEDRVWSMLATVAEEWPLGRSNTLAKSLLRRRLLPHFKIKQGKAHVVQSVLDRFADKIAVVDLSSTVYKEKEGETVFVAGSEIEDIRKLSFAISVHTDRPETESLLVVLEPGAADEIEAIAMKAQCLVQRRLDVKKPSVRPIVAARGPRQEDLAGAAQGAIALKEALGQPRKGTGGRSRPKK